MINKIPRAVYYMDILTPFRTLIRWMVYQNKKGYVDEFKKRLVEKFNCSNLSLVSHARVGLYLSLKAKNIKLDDEVLMTPINLPDMVNMIKATGANQRYLDINLKNLSIDTNELQAKITDKTKVVFITLLNGYIPELDVLYEICKKNKITLIIDATQAVGGLYKNLPIHKYADITIFALCDLKVIHTHMGAMVNIEDDSTFKKFQRGCQELLNPLTFKYLKRFLIEDAIAVLLLNRKVFSIFIFPFLKKMNLWLGVKNIEGFTKGDGIKIGNIILFKGLFGGGANVVRGSIPKEMFYEYHDVQARIGLDRLKIYDEIEKKRLHNSRLFIKNLKNKNILPEDYDNQANVFWRMPIIVDNKERLQEHLIRYGIDASKSNLPVLSNIRGLGTEETTPTANYFADNSLNIPLHHYLSENEVIMIAKAINEYYEENSNDKRN